MFGKGRIQKHGEQAKAVVLDSDMSGYQNSKALRKWKLTLRVQFDDGSTGEASCSAYPTSPAGAFNPGDIVPVRYSPKDRTAVEVDQEAMAAASEARRQAGREGLVRLAEERLSRGED
jgi:hypothetical protein